jgi:hypothetical protein
MSDSDKKKEATHAALERLLARVPEVKDSVAANSRWTVREKKTPDPDSLY